MAAMPIPTSVACLHASRRSADSKSSFTIPYCIRGTKRGNDTVVLIDSVQSLLRIRRIEQALTANIVPVNAHSCALELLYPRFGINDIKLSVGCERSTLPSIPLQFTLASTAKTAIAWKTLSGPG